MVLSYILASQQFCEVSKAERELAQDYPENFIAEKEGMWIWHNIDAVTAIIHPQSLDPLTLLPPAQFCTPSQRWLSTAECILLALDTFTVSRTASFKEQKRHSTTVT